MLKRLLGLGTILLGTLWLLGATHFVMNFASAPHGAYPMIYILTRLCYGLLGLVMTGVGFKWLVFR